MRRRNSFEAAVCQNLTANLPCDGPLRSALAPSSEFQEFCSSSQEAPPRRAGVLKLKPVSLSATLPCRSGSAMMSGVSRDEDHSSRGRDRSEADAWDSGTRASTACQRDWIG